MTGDFERGDIVQLRSGGPLLTVEYTYYSEDAETHKCGVQWFDEHNMLKSAEFPHTSLKKVKA